MKNPPIHMLLLMLMAVLSVAQHTKKTPISKQEILSVLGEPVSLPGEPGPVLTTLPDQVRPSAQPVKPQTTLNVEPLPSSPVSGADVITSLLAACQALKSFISRSEFVQRQMTMMPPDLMPWLYAQKVGFPTECGYSSYSNALNVFATACTVFETCPLPTPETGMMQNFAAGFEMPQVGHGLGPLPVASQPVPIQPFPMQDIPFQPVSIQQGPVQQAPVQAVPIPSGPVEQAPVPVKPRAPSISVPGLPVISPDRRKVQVQAQQFRIPLAPQTSAEQPPRVQVITKVAQRQAKDAQTPTPAVTQNKQVAQPQQMFQRMPVPSMASIYPMWAFGFQQAPAMGASVRLHQQATTPRPVPEHDGSD